MNYLLCTAVFALTMSVANAGVTTIYSDSTLHTSRTNSWFKQDIADPGTWYYANNPAVAQIAAQSITSNLAMTGSWSTPDANNFSRTRSVSIQNGPSRPAPGKIFKVYAGGDTIFGLTPMAYVVLGAADGSTIIRMVIGQEAVSVALLAVSGNLSVNSSEGCIYVFNATLSTIEDVCNILTFIEANS